MASSETPVPKAPAARPKLARSQTMLQSVAEDATRVTQAAVEAANSLTFIDAETDPTAEERQVDLDQLTAEVLTAANTHAPDQVRQRAVAKALAGLLSAEMKSTRYRFWFVAGTFDLVVTALWLGSSPTTFRYLWLLKLSIIMAQRLWVFARRRMLFFLLSLCYICSLAGAAQICYFPTSIAATKMMFAVGIGPMAGTALLMRNRLVLHEWNSLALLFIHWGLGLMFWAIRWYPPARLAAHIAASPAAAAEWGAVSFQHFFVWPSLLYAAWAVLFSVIIHVLFAGVIRRGKYDTQYSKSLEGGMGIISAITNSFPRPLRPLSFLLAQYVLYAPPLAYTPLAWNNYYFGIFMLAMIFTAATWHGSKQHLKPSGGAARERGAKRQ